MDPLFYYYIDPFIDWRFCPIIYPTENNERLIGKHPARSVFSVDF